jgi:hypothetical protein
MISAAQAKIAEIETEVATEKRFLALLEQRRLSLSKTLSLVTSSVYWVQLQGPSLKQYTGECH